MAVENIEYWWVNLHWNWFGFSLMTSNDLEVIPKYKNNLGRLAR